MNKTLFKIGSVLVGIAIGAGSLTATGPVSAHADARFKADTTQVQPDARFKAADAKTDARFKVVAKSPKSSDKEAKAQKFPRYQPSYVSNVAGDKVKVKFKNKDGKVSYRWLVQRGSATSRCGDKGWTTRNCDNPGSVIAARSKADDRCAQKKGWTSSGTRKLVKGKKWIKPGGTDDNYILWRPYSDCDPDNGYWNE